MNPPSPEILQFPTPFAIRAFGQDQDDFQLLVFNIVQRHVPDLSLSAVTQRSSSGGKYLAVTVRFTATSRGQLEAIYGDLSAHEKVVMVL